LNKQSHDLQQFMLRLPDGMRDDLRKRAELNGRSMNSEIVMILAAALYDGRRR
jgi:plasmid stability protein